MYLSFLAIKSMFLQSLEVQEGSIVTIPNTETIKNPNIAHIWSRGLSMKSLPPALLGSGSHG